MTLFAIIFFSSFLLLWALLNYFTTLYLNNIALPVIKRFTEHISTINPIMYRDIKARYSEFNGDYMEIVFYGSSCDIYLFENYIVVVRRYKSLFRRHIEPIILTYSEKDAYKAFPYLNIFRPEKLLFKQIIKGEVEFRFTDFKRKYYRMELTLKALNPEQKAQLERVFFSELSNLN